MSTQSGGPLFDVRSLPGWTPLDCSPPSAPRFSAAKGAPEGRSKAAAAATASTTAVKPPPCPRRLPAEWVKTADDAVEFFAHYGSDALVQFFYCLKSGDGGPLVGDSGSPSAGGPPSQAPPADPASAEFFLRVVPPEHVTHAPTYYILSERELVKVDRRAGEHTETMPLAEWVAHKRAFLCLRRLTFCSFGLARCFQLWRSNSRARVLRRRRRQLERSLLLAAPAFQGALLEAGGLLCAVRAAHAARIQPARLYTTAGWAEQQGGWRARKAQPDLEAAAAQLVRVAEGVCMRVEAAAEEALRSLRPHELQDRIGVDLHAATSRAKARSMQQIKQDKLDRAEQYHARLRERSQLQRLLRMLDLRLAGALAEGAAACVVGAAAALRSAAPGLPQTVGHQRLASAGSEAEEGDDQQEGEEGEGGSGGGNPAFLCAVTLEAEGSASLSAAAGIGICFSPSEAEWAAVLEAEVVGSSLHLASASVVKPLLSLPAFERYQALLAAEVQAAEAGAAATGVEAAGAAAGAGSAPGAADMHSVGDMPQASAGNGGSAGCGEGSAHMHRQGAAELAQRDPALLAASAEMRHLLECSFSVARRLARQYQRYHAIRRFGQTFDFDSWADRQRASLDLARTEAMMRQLQGWQEELQDMPLQRNAGLLRLDAAGLQASLRPVVSSAQEHISGLLLQQAGDRCRQLHQDLVIWREVAAARPAELDGFLPWAASLAHMRQEMEGQLAAVNHVDAALALVVAFAGRLPTAEAVKRDDLAEAAASLPSELAAAEAFAAEQRAVHAAAAAEQAGALAEEAILLESEVQAGMYVDAGAVPAEVPADLDLQQSRVAQLAAQAEEVAAVQQELGGTAGNIPEVRDAEAALEVGLAQFGNPAAAAALLPAVQRCTKLWTLVAQAEQLQQLPHSEGTDGAAAALREQLAALRAVARLQIPCG